jgi:hypothetical protein
MTKLVVENACCRGGRCDGTSTVVWSAEFEPASHDRDTARPIRDFLKAGLNNVAASYT